MSGQTAFGYYDVDAKLVSYWFMGAMSLDEIEEYSDNPLNVIVDSAKPMLAGNCLLDEFKSVEFRHDNNVKWAVMYLSDSTVCYSFKSIVIMKKRML